MNPIYASLDWDREAPHFAAVSRFLAAILGQPIPTSLARFRERFEQARSLDVPQTGFTPLMLHTLYAVAATRRSASPIGCGTYVGVAFSMIVAGSVDAQVTEVSGLGFDPDLESTAKATRNAGAMQLGDRVHYVASEPIEALQKYCGQLDLLFLDVDDPVRGKADYPILFELADRCAAPGAVVLAHDACVARCQDDLARLSERIKQTRRYRGPWVLPVDRAGILMAVRA